MPEGDIDGHVIESDFADKAAERGEGIKRVSIDLLENGGMRGTA
jgi:hypothetical protein